LSARGGIEGVVGGWSVDVGGGVVTPPVHAKVVQRETRSARVRAGPGAVEAKAGAPAGGDRGLRDALRTVKFAPRTGREHAVPRWVMVWPDGKAKPRVHE